LDALTGQPVWEYLGDITWRGNCFSITDGILYASSQDGFLYAFGEGPTKTTVSIVSSNMVTGSAALIKGSVLDLSPASPYAPVAGAQVSLYVAMTGDSYSNIATATTASDGTFTYEWTLPDSGFYNVIAGWDGDESYLSSMGSTDLAVGPEPEEYVAPLINSLTELDDSIGDLRGSVSDVEDSVSSLDSSVSDLSSLEGSVDSLDSSVSDLEGSVGSLESSTSDLTNYLFAIMALVIIAIVIAVYSVLKPRK
jgi:hypothetical protein